MDLPVEQTIIQIKKLFPNIESLEMSLSEEKDVSYILS